MPDDAPEIIADAPVSEPVAPAPVDEETVVNAAIFAIVEVMTPIPHAMHNLIMHRLRDLFGG